MKVGGGSTANPDESPKSEPIVAQPPQAHSRLSWLRVLTIVAWLALGAPAGWAASTLLWHAGYLNPRNDELSTFLVMVGPMILTAAFGARKNPEVLRRLIAFPLLLAGFVWLLGLPALSVSPAQALSRIHVNEFYPFWVFPAAILGGVIAVVSVKLRSKN